MSKPLSGLLGAVLRVQPRITHAMGGLIAERRAGQRLALIGETAHAFPPIGAQGLNLTLRDIAEIRDRVVAARAGGSDIGSPMMLEAYDKARAQDVTGRVWGVDLLNQSLIAGPLPGLARGLGLHALHALPPLKRLAMRHGFGAKVASADSSRPSTGAAWT
jgi:2-octaprenyl-6-methoxyphenol hydroxylase